ncbi:MAG TPA: DUF6485 family protein [Tenuifilaceae bacterium]|nr:DUF6485 family protein [Tenuifilaceae bacterium]
MDCKKESNSVGCRCTYPCTRHGVCCDCLMYHRKKGQLPACYFPKDVETGYDRSIANFTRVISERGTGFLMDDSE